MMETLIEKALSTWLNHTINLDASGKKKLSALNGKLFLLRCTRPDIGFYIIIEDATINLQRFGTRSVNNIPADDLEDIKQLVPSATLEGSASKLLALLQASEPAAALGLEGLELRGDFSAFECFLDLFKQLEPDYEEPLAKIIGDVPAHGVGKLIRSFTKNAKQQTESVTQKAQNYFHSQSLSPTQNELDSFQSNISKLRQDSNRLKAKVERFEINHQTKE